jgi:DnaK suppressor protein
VPTAYTILCKILEHERGRLMQEIERLNTLREEGVDYGNDVADDATEAFEQSMNLALSESLKGSLSRVEDALQRFQDGSYGICEDCARAIEWGRLEVLPHARLCVECAQRRERGT